MDDRVLRTTVTPRRALPPIELLPLPPPWRDTHQSKWCAKTSTCGTTKSLWPKAGDKKASVLQLVNPIIHQAAGWTSVQPRTAVCVPGFMQSPGRAIPMIAQNCNQLSDRRLQARSATAAGSHRTDQPVGYASGCTHSTLMGACPILPGVVGSAHCDQDRLISGHSGGQRADRTVGTKSCPRLVLPLCAG